MKIVINEPPRSKKNSMQIIRLGNRYSLTQSKQYKEYKRNCAKYLTDVVAEPIDFPVSVKCTFRTERNLVCMSISRTKTAITK